MSSNKTELQCIRCGKESSDVEGWEQWEHVDKFALCPECIWRIREEDPTDLYRNNMPVCPYCGWSEVEYEEYSDEVVVDCPACGRKFSSMEIIDTCYTTGYIPLEK